MRNNHPSRRTKIKFPTYYSKRMKHRLPSYRDNPLAKTIEIRVTKIPSPPSPFSKDEYYGSESSVYVIINKIRDAYE